MRFQSYNKNLRLIVETPRRHVYPNGLFEQVPGKVIQFQGGMFETEDESEISFLHKHRLYNQSVGTPGAFWTYVPPRDLEAEAREKDAEIAKLKAQLAAASNVTQPAAPEPPVPAAQPEPAAPAAEDPVASAISKVLKEKPLAKQPK